MKLSPLLLASIKPAGAEVEPTGLERDAPLTCESVARFAWCGAPTPASAPRQHRALTLAGVADECHGGNVKHEFDHGVEYVITLHDMTRVRLEWIATERVDNDNDNNSTVERLAKVQY